MADMIFSARFFDGKTTKPITAQVQILADGLKIIYRHPQTICEIFWPSSTLQLMERLHGNKPGVVGSKLLLGARLIIPHQKDYEQVLTLIHPKNVKLAHVHHSWKLLWIIPVILLFMLVLPIWKIHAVALYIANIIPPSFETLLWEKGAAPEVSELTVCTHPAGVKALQTLMAKLTTAGEVTYPIDVKVIYAPNTINAMALPDYRIFVYSETLTMGPDALAAILAHELGHSVYHHSMAKFISQMGLSTVFKGILGISGNNIAFDFLNLKYSRDYERQADQYALKILKKAAIRPEGFEATMKYLESLSGDFVGIEEYLVDHPSFKERLKLLPPKEPNAAPTKPALTPAEWKALQSICNETAPFD